MSKARNSQPDLSNLSALAKLMDAQFRIPGTEIRFGLDALIGLIPGAGDFVSFLISSYLISLAINKGASGYVLSRMLLNIVIDALVGSIPVLGDLFDIAYKANQRNVKLLQAHYKEGKHQGSARKVIIPVMIIVLGVLVLIAWGIYELFVWIF